VRVKTVKGSKEHGKKNGKTGKTEEPSSGLDPHVLRLLEHPLTITIGKAGSIENLLVTKECLAEKGVSLLLLSLCLPQKLASWGCTLAGPHC
jgi:hypothetical protein